MRARNTRRNRNTRTMSTEACKEIRPSKGSQLATDGSSPSILGLLVEEAFELFHFLRRQPFLTDEMCQHGSKRAAKYARQKCFAGGGGGGGLRNERTIQIRAAFLREAQRAFFHETVEERLDRLRRPLLGVGERFDDVAGRKRGTS